MTHRPENLIALDGMVAELVAVESALEETRQRLVRVTDTLGAIARLPENDHDDWHHHIAPVPGNWR